MSRTIATADAPVEQRRESLEDFRRDVTRERDDWARRESAASWHRLLVFVTGVLVWVFLSAWPWIALGLTAVVVGGFIASVRRHARLRARREFLDRLVKVCNESGERLGGAVKCIRAWQRPADDGDVDAALPKIVDDGETWTLTEQEIGDLDVFAPPVGVFGLLNRTSTAIGARRLRDALSRPMVSAQRIVERQSAVQWCDQHSEQRLRVLAAFAVLRDEDKRLAKLVRAVDIARPLNTFVSPTVLRIWSIFTTLVTLVAISFVGAGEYGMSVVLALVAAINGFAFFKIRDELVDAMSPWRDVTWAVNGVLIAAEQAAAEFPDDGELGALHQKLAAVLPKRVLGGLGARLAWAESGGMMQAMLNLVMLADLHIAHTIVRRVVPHRTEILEAVAALAEAEMLLSLGAFAWEQPIACYPTPSETIELFIRGGRHPLVNPERVVPNDVHLGVNERVWIVTGSNMAGKSTLLRMSAVNTLLAQIGGVATAEEMRWSPMRLMSDLRASDNLANNESYFLAEVRHLRRMVLAPEDHVPIFGLIDEPFRGTNSQDQSAASIAVVRHLMQTRNLFLLATHDRHVTTLADDRVARNYHFRENLGSDGMVFDYQLHDGPATTRNALRILEKEGYPAPLMREAHAWLESQETEDA